MEPSPVPTQLTWEQFLVAYQKKKASRHMHGFGRPSLRLLNVDFCNQGTSALQCYGVILYHIRNVASNGYR